MVVFFENSTLSRLDFGHKLQLMRYRLRSGNSIMRFSGNFLSSMPKRGSQRARLCVCVDGVKYNVNLGLKLRDYEVIFRLIHGQCSTVKYFLV